MDPTTQAPPSGGSESATTPAPAAAATTPATTPTADAAGLEYWKGEAAKAFAERDRATAALRQV